MASRLGAEYSAVGATDDEQDRCGDQRECIACQARSAARDTTADTLSGRSPAAIRAAAAPVLAPSSPRAVLRPGGATVGRPTVVSAPGTAVPEGARDDRTAGRQFAPAPAGSERPPQRTPGPDDAAPLLSSTWRLRHARTRRCPVHHGKRGRMPDRSTPGRHEGVRTVPTLLFDGDCGFCTTAVRWIERNVSPRCESVARQRLDLRGIGVTRQRAQREALWVTPAGTG